MHVKDVPQDDGMNKGMKEIAYAVDDNGRYITVGSLGWEPKNVANEQAWEAISEEIEMAIEAIEAGKRSPLAYYMAKHLMTVGLLASYVGLPRWRVRRHLKPKVFQRLPLEIRQRYAQVFNISVDQLNHIPDRHRS